MPSYTIEVTVAVGPLELEVPLEVDVDVSFGFHGSYYDPPEPPEFEWTVYRRLDGLQDHDGVQTALDAYMERHADDEAEKLWDRLAPDDG